MRAYHRTQEIMRHFSVPAWRKYQWRSGQGWLCPKVHLARLMLLLIVGYCRGRTFFVTENGFMGTAPDLIQADDLIALFSGVEMPMAVRAIGGHYHLVTHAYVHG